MDKSAVFEMLRAFPSLANALKQLPKQPEDPIVWLQQQEAMRAGQGRISAAKFILYMLDVEPFFDLRRAWGSWDDAHRLAFVSVLLGKEVPPDLHARTYDVLARVQRSLN